MAQRGISAKQRAWLVGELEAWQSRQIISADQSASLLALYETPAELAERGRSKLLLTLMGVAALLIGLAVLLLVGYNWQEMPAAVKLAIIFAALVATHTAAFVLLSRDWLLLSEVAFLLGCLIYGVAIFLISQIFHLSGHAPDAVWWWAVGVLPFALCLDTVLLHVLIVALLAIWCGMEVLGFGDVGGWFFGRWGFIPNSAPTLLLFASIGLVWVYRRRLVAAVWLYVPLVAWWAILQPFAWRLSEPSVFFIGFVAGVMLIIAECHRPLSPFAAPYRELGTLLLAGVLLTLSFYDFNKEIFGHDNFTADRSMEPFLGAGGPWFLAAFAWIIFAAAAFWAYRSPRQAAPPSGTSINRLLPFVRRQWLPVGMVVLMTFLILWWALKLGPALPTILANVAMIVVGFSLIATGLRQNSGREFTAGVVYLLTWVVMRYIDLFGDFGGMLGAAAIFFLCGLALFGMAWFWRHRNEVYYG